VEKYASLARSPLTVLAVLWAMLWILVSIAESAGYLHDPTIALWQPLMLIFILACTIGVWVGLELRSSRYLDLPLDPPRDWFRRQLRRLPLLASGYIVIVIGGRSAIFALAGAAYRHAPWPILIPFEFIKASLFYCLWLGLVFGALSQIVAREQAVALGLMQKALAEAQLAQLRAQLRPHFLFNTMNTVSALMHSDVKRADRLLARLADLLRASLGGAETMQERFQGRVSTDWQIADEALAARVPAMLLQPLLENAFKYGVEQTTGCERICILAQRQQNRLQLKIQNTGSMLRPGWCEGVGLANCRERLRVLHGDAATVSIQSLGSAVEASISMPWDVTAP